MAQRFNALGQPVGAELAGWTAPPAPPPERLSGRHCYIEPLDADRHGADLFAANSLDPAGRNWTYLPYGPFSTLADYMRWVASVAHKDDPQFHAIVATDGGRASGVASYLRIDREAGSIEVGHINYSPLLQRTRTATEAMYLMMKRVFELGYRRYEWKCDALNAASRTAALRFGFSYEGIFRQARVTKGRNRDTAWYAAIDAEWPALDRAFQRWLDPSNFDERGRQRVSLRDLTAPILIDQEPT